MSGHTTSAHRIWHHKLMGHSVAAEAWPSLAAAAHFDQPGFSVYRNTVRKAYIDALQANYPSVVRLVGDEWFRAAANRYALTHTCHDPRLLLYGAGFDTFLAGFEPAQALPFLASIASLDRAWTLSHVAADAPVLSAQELLERTQSNPAALHLQPHPSAHWLQHDSIPIATLWQRSRTQQDEDADIAWVGEAILLTRPNASVQWRTTTAAACAFLNACQQQQDADEACQAALAVQPDADLGALVADLIAAGALQSLSFNAF
jgi:hypothetical protein